MGPLDVLAPAAVEPGWATSLPAILGALVVVLEIAVVVAALGVIPGTVVLDRDGPVRSSCWPCRCSVCWPS